MGCDAARARTGCLVVRTVAFAARIASAESGIGGEIDGGDGG